MVSVSNLVADKIWHVNVDGTQYVIDKCREHNACLIFISPEMDGSRKSGNKSC